MSVVTLLTDFGSRDPFVGEMKLVLLRLAPGVPIVDLSHGIAPGAIREAAWVLRKSYRQAPAGSVHVAVVDPGVGSERRALAARAGGHVFLGPDNGVLMPALEDAGIDCIHEIVWRDADHRRAGTTFDGRDVFAPEAARIFRGARVEEVGPEVHDPVAIAPYRPAPAPEGGMRVEVVRADRYGNLVTAAEETYLRDTYGEDWRAVGVNLGAGAIRGIRLGYAEVEPGEWLLSIGGGGTLEISVRGGSAQRKSGLKAGDFIRIVDPPR